MVAASQTLGERQKEEKAGQSLDKRLSPLSREGKTFVTEEGSMDPSNWSAGTQIASYTLHRRRPHAWWGDDWLAVTSSQQEVWLWSLSRSSFPWVSDDRWELFQEQAESLPTLSHPFVLSCLDSFPLTEDTWCLVWQAPLATPSQPQTLEQLLKNEPNQRFTEDYANSLWDDLLKGLQHLHGRGLIHGCLSPTTVAIDWGSGIPEVRLSHCGLFALLPSYEGSTPLSDSPYAPLPPGYLAPERRALAPSQTEHPRTDLFAAGGLLWRMLTGTPPPNPLDPNSSKLSSLEDQTQLRLTRTLEPDPSVRESHCRPLLQETSRFQPPTPRVDLDVLQSRHTLPYSLDLPEDPEEDTYAQQLHSDVQRLLESDPNTLVDTRDTLEPLHEDDFLQTLALDPATSTQQLSSPENQRMQVMDVSFPPTPIPRTLKSIPTDWEREALQADLALYRNGMSRWTLLLGLLLLTFILVLGFQWGLFF